MKTAAPLTLDDVLNVSGGTLTFTTSGYAFAVENDYARSTTENDPSGSSTLTLVVTMGEGDSLSFDYKADIDPEGGSLGFYCSKIDGALSGIYNQSLGVSGHENTWTSFTFVAPRDGEYEFVWNVGRDDYNCSGEYTNIGYVDNVQVIEAEIAVTVLGDVNCDGTVTFADITVLYAAIVGTGTIGEQGIVNADADGDGALGFNDVSALYKIILSAE